VAVTGGSSFDGDPPANDTHASVARTERPFATTRAALSATAVRAFLKTEAATSAVRSVVATKVPASDVDDLVNDVMVEAMKAADRAPPADASVLPAWTAALARHLLADFLTKRARRRKYEGAMPVEADDAAAHPGTIHDPWADDDDDFTAGAMAWLHSAVASDGQDRETLAMLLERYRDGKTYAQIAEERGLPLSTVSSRVFLFKAKYGPRYRRHRATRFAVVVAVLAAVALTIFWTLLPDLERAKGAHPPPRSSAPP
jgi:RNA polymerase sigma factor (sigma-70 family)